MRGNRIANEKAQKVIGLKKLNLRCDDEDIASVLLNVQAYMFFSFLFCVCVCVRHHHSPKKRVLGYFQDRRVPFSFN